MARRTQRQTLGDTVGFLVVAVLSAVVWAGAIAVPVLLAGVVALAMLLAGGGVAILRAIRGRNWRVVARTWLATTVRATDGAIVGWVLAWRSAAERARRRVQAHSGTPITAAYRPLPPTGSPGRAQALVQDPMTWRDAAYFVVVAIVGVPVTAIVIGAWLLPLVGIVAPLVLQLVALNDPVVAEAVEVTEPFARDNAVGLFLLLVVVAALAPLLTRAVAHGMVGLAEALLRPGRQALLRAEVAEQRQRRQLAVEAAETERRRIERDLHDGAQQRLVSVAMSLGVARQKFGADPAGAEALVAEAHAEAKQALAELRDLARGIHPAVLADRGLDAAVSALARRAGVPVGVDVALPRRPPTAVESVAYFVIAEALTNVARHAVATRATVTVSARADQLVVEVADDGVGGADPSAGTGLAGLADRVAAVDGMLRVTSPAGGPTTVTAELPCAW